LVMSRGFEFGLPQSG